MESNEEREELMEEYLLVGILIKDNPCGMPHGVISSLKNVLNDFIGKHCIQGASREQVARYLQIDVRTLTRWRNEYDDFPNAGHYGHKEISFNWVDIIRWKLNHKELFKHEENN